jgi:hypothetical protein
MESEGYKKFKFFFLIKKKKNAVLELKPLCIINLKLESTDAAVNMLALIY